MKNHVFKILSAFALFGAANALVGAERPTLASLLGQAQDQIESASHRGELSGLDPARLAVDKALVLDAKSAWAWYYKGYAAYIEALLQESKHDAVAKENALTEADHALEKSLELQRSGEALALHVMVLAQLMRVRGPESGAQLGPQMGQELAEAHRSAPNSPRVLMVAGISALFTPPQWGGDLHKAEKLLEQAAAAANQEKSSPPQPSWGRAETHVWLGMAHQKLGDEAKAKSDFEHALALDPNYAWVKDSLLPKMDHSSKP